MTGTDRRPGGVGGPPPSTALAWHVTGSVPADRAAVPFVRHAVVELLERHGTSQAVAGRVALAVTEAATNVVLHAYGADHREGNVRFDADIEEGDLEVVVTDTGTGLRADTRSDGLGLGLHLIAAVTDDFAIADSRAGLEVWMRFVLDAH